MSHPILYSFRRCPYAMRARLAIASAGMEVELREVVLRDKPPSMIEASPKATVPVLVDGEEIIDESLDIMRWALSRHDPEGWLFETGDDLVTENDGPFKRALDRYKYPGRYPEEAVDPLAQRAQGEGFIAKLEAQLDRSPWLSGSQPRFADMAILPFVRQFAHVDTDWWDSTPFTAVQDWLRRFKASDRFKGIMLKYDQWQEGTKGVPFP